MNNPNTVPDAVSKFREEYVMADEPQIDDDDVLELGPEDEVSPEEQPPETNDEASDQDDDGEVTIEIEGEEEPENETPVIKQMRVAMKEKDRRIAELEKTSAPAPIEVGPEPVWGDGDEWEWDGDKFDAAKTAWRTKRDAAAAQTEKAKEADLKRAEAFKSKQADYQQRAKSLGVKDYAEAETTVCLSIPEVTQGLMIRYLPEAEKVVLALGKNPKHLERIAAMDDPVEQLMALKDFAGKIKMVKRNAPPPPEERISGSGKIAPEGNGEKKLAQMEKDWEKSGGSRDKIIAYKRQLNAKGGKK